MMHADIFIVGAGAAGIAAAKAAAEAGKSVILADREEGFGGVLRRCAHRGFGEGLTGPEYTERLVTDFPQSVRVLFSTTVLSISPDKTALLSSREMGLFSLAFSHMILASGCMEISAGMLPIGGTRPAGVYTAGEAQLLSFEGIPLPSPVVILGSGDLGLIMAKQLTEGGHSVSCIIEKNSAPAAMARNRGILDKVPFLPNSTVREIRGEKLIQSVVIKNLLSGREEEIPCAALLIAAGLKEDRSLVRGMETAPWLTFCGNCRRIYPMVEGLYAESKEAAKAACERIESV